MAFFDLSIPYAEKGGDGRPGVGRSRESLLRTAARAMELGYTGVAYDSSSSGVLSDSNLCHISPFTPKSFIDVCASFAAFTATISLHRDLLGVPRDSTFRQYRRITISIESTVAAAALNSRNRLIKSYDLVAVRPLNQMAFDQACQTSEVDIIALDLSQKLPFRLKLPMVQSAIKRGLHFEICYSHLIADSHTRRQVLADAKLLGDWTRGKNLIISSAANSFNEVRGPHDVANLATVFLGITMERAKAAVSRNCRSLLANALRKKDCYYKEAIKVERFLPEKYMDSNEDWFKEWTDWDPISSGEGELPSLDDMAKLFAAASEHSKNQNATDFTSSINGTAPSAPFFSNSNTDKHNSADESRSCNGFEQHSNISCVTPDNMTLMVAKYLPTTTNEEKPSLDTNGMAIDASENFWCPNLNGFFPAGEIKPSNVSMKDLELADQLDNVSSSMKPTEHVSESLQCSSVGTRDQISAVVKIMKGFSSKNVATEEKGEALHDEFCRTTDAQVGEGTSIDMQTDNHPDMLLEIQEQSRVLCETSTTVDPSKMEEHEQLIAPSEASSSKNDQAKLKLGRPRTSAVVVESTKEALADGLKVMSHKKTIDKIQTSSQFFKRTESKKLSTAIIPHSDALLDEPPSPAEEEPCFFPENKSSAKVAVTMVGKNVELPLTTSVVTQGHLQKSGKRRRKGRQQYRPYGLALKNLCKPIFFKRAASRLRRPGKLM